MNLAEQLATTACITKGVVKCEEASTGNQSMAAYTGRLFRHLLSKTAAADAAEPKNNLAPLARASGSFVMASPSSHFDSQWQNILALGTPGMSVNGNGVAAAGPAHVVSPFCRIPARARLTQGALCRWTKTARPRRRSST